MRLAVPDIGSGGDRLRASLNRRLLPLCDPRTFVLEMSINEISLCWFSFRLVGGAIAVGIPRGGHSPRGWRADVRVLDASRF